VDELHQDLALGREALAADPTHRDSWEVRRLPLAGLPAPLVSQHFHRLLIGLCQVEAGLAGPEVVAAALADLPPGDPRWYGPEHPQVPPDIDFLGLLLQGAAVAGEPEPGWIDARLARLDTNLGADGLPTVWLPFDATGHRDDEDGPEWPGDDCTASRLSLLLGLRATDRRHLLQQRLLDALEGPLGHGPEYGDYYYVRGWTSAQLARLVQGDGHPALRGWASRHREDRRSLQRLDGSYGGSPLATALHLTLDVHTDADDSVIWRALRYLSETQGPDGTWGEEGLYLMPGKTVDQRAWHAGRSLTTALCLRAMAEGLRRLEPTT